MNAAFGWLGQFFEWFGKFVPRLIIVPTTHGGVKFVRGKHVKELKAGLHVYLPLVTETIIYPITRQTNQLEPQVIVTKDGQSVTISCIITYEIDDVVSALSKTWNIDEVVNDVAQMGVVSVITDNTFDQLMGDIDSKIKEQLTEAARETLSDFGVKVLNCSLIEISPCLVIKTR